MLREYGESPAFYSRRPPDRWDQYCTLREAVDFWGNNMIGKGQFSSGPLPH